MKKITIIISVMFLLGIVIGLNLANQTDSSVQKTNLEENKQLTFSETITSVDGQLIDVREPYEYEASHADGAINIPLGDILNSDFSKIDTDRPIFVYCRTGNRSSQAKEFLEGSGFSGITDIGGLSDWQAQGNKVCLTSAVTCS